MNDHALAEWEQWKTLCQLLKESGAVSQSDLESKQSARDTSGQILLAVIRDWGDKLVALRMSHGGKQ